MSEPERRVDDEASKAIKRIETQMRLEGKLDKAEAAEGAGMLLLPLVLGATGLVAWALKSMGLEGPAMVFIAVPVILGLLLLGAYLAHRR